MPRCDFNAFERLGEIQSVSKSMVLRDKMSNHEQSQELQHEQCQNLLHNVKNAYIKEKIQRQAVQHKQFFRTFARNNKFKKVWYHLLQTRL